MAAPRNTPVPVYLRGIPAEVVREAKAQAARRGITLAGFVADTLARAMDSTGSFQRENLPSNSDELQVEARWFERNRERLERQYAGQFIAIVKQRVVDHDATFEALAERVFKLRGSRDTYMPEVRVQKKALRLRSPRIARDV